MTPFSSLIVPILLSAIAVFILSSVIHMVMPWHKGDYARLPDEDGVLDALRPFAVPPGDYMAPSPRSAQEMKSPDFMAKRQRGPVVLMTVMPNGGFAMGKLMGSWFVFTLLVACIAGGVASHTVAPGGDSHAVFHYTGLITLLSYTLGEWPLSIWYSRKWSTTMKGVLDGVIYAVATGLIFVWRWPGI